MASKKYNKLAFSSTVDAKHHNRMKTAFETRLLPFLEKHLSDVWKDLFSRFKFSFTARKCLTKGTAVTVMKRWGAQHIKSSAIAGTPMTGLISVQVPDSKHGFLFWVDIDIPDGDEEIRKGLFAHIKGLQVETFPTLSPKPAGAVAANAATAQPLGTSVSFHMQTPTVDTSSSYASANSWLITTPPPNTPHHPEPPHREPDPVRRPALLHLDQILSELLPSIPDKNLGAAVSITAELRSSLQIHVDAWKRIEELVELLRRLVPTTN